MQEIYVRTKGKGIKAYFTVEASMIIPMVIFLFAIIFYLTFFLYDRCIASQDAYILAFRGSICCDMGTGEIEQYVRKQAQEQFGKRYMALTGFTEKVQADRNKVEVEITGEIKSAFAKQLLNNGRWNFQENAAADRICPTHCIRKFRLVRKLGDGIEESGIAE